MYKKRILISLLGVVLVFALFACGTDSTAGSEKVNGEQMTLDLPFGETTGEYTGEVENNEPNGEGSFTAESEEGEKWTYTGQWKDGLMDGQGVIDYEDTSFDDDCGTFVKGTWTPTAGDYYTSSGTSADDNYKVSEVSQKFMNDNKDLFPAKSESLIKDDMIQDVEFEDLAKDISKYDDKLIKKNLKISQSFVVDDGVEALGVENTTWITAYDEDFNAYTMIYLGVLNLKEDQDVTIYGLPIGKNAYPNEEGGETETVVLAPSLIK